ncbi:MAG: T9SS type A sorting domain-containing protein [Bacteroidales bacterium]|nr:T9SS type A sorting domain-containing protein [Bacteroidales bacterium]
MSGTSAASCIGTAQVEVFVDAMTPRFSGQVFYNNAMHSPLSDVRVVLADISAAFSLSDSSDATGYYMIGGVPSGTYLLNAATSREWGGGNAVDALAIMRHFTQSAVLNGLALEASDLNADGATNATDAAMVAQRFVENISSFPSGDWLFAKDTLYSDGVSDQLHDIQGLCFGDVNQSYIPATKSLYEVEVINENALVVSEESFLLPVYLSEDIIFGAISLDLTFDPGLFGIEDILFNTESGRGLWKAEGGRVRIAWFNSSGWQAGPGDAFFYLKITIKHTWLSDGYGEEAILFKEVNGEFANESAEIIRPASLTIPTIQWQRPDGLQIRVSPNPGRDMLNVFYSLPEDGELQMVLRDISGRIIEVIQSNRIQKGVYTQEKDMSELAPGVYFLSLRLSAPARTYYQETWIIRE